MSVLKFARTAERPNSAPVERLETELHAVRTAHSQLWEIEREAKKDLDLRAHRLSWDLKLHGTGYRRLSLEPLSWARLWRRWARPVFAVYPLVDPTMTIRAGKAVRTNGGHFLDSGGPSRTDFSRSNPSILPEPIQDCFKAVSDKLPDRIRSTFTGVIPPEAREAIKEASPFFTQDGKARPDIFIVAEADWRWDREPVPAPRNLDPLVVGWDGRDLWLISTFDLTDLERYMVAEFPALAAHEDKLGLPEHRG